MEHTSERKCRERAEQKCRAALVSSATLELSDCPIMGAELDLWLIAGDHMAMTGEYPTLELAAKLSDALSIDLESRIKRVALSLGNGDPDRSIGWFAALSGALPESWEAPARWEAIQVASATREAIRYSLMLEHDNAAPDNREISLWVSVGRVARLYGEYPQRNMLAEHPQRAALLDRIMTIVGELVAQSPIRLPITDYVGELLGPKDPASSGAALDPAIARRSREAVR